MKRINFHGLFTALFLVFSLDSFAEQYPHKLIVLVEGAKANTGQAIASLFSSADNYLKEPVFKQLMPINDTGEVRFVFNELKAGKYAVSIVYDEDGDGKLNTGFLGIPSELVGFSNNAKGTFGHPSFHKAFFTIPESETISIVLGQAKD
jgi:uncharacterized protein (DUF2141 family)